MSIDTAMLLTALGAAVYMLSHGVRMYAVIAVCVAGLQLAMRMGWMTFGIRGVPLNLLFAAVISACGAVMFGKSSSKFAVAASTVVVLLGALQLLRALGLS
ncbi:MAG: hypothetical protein OEZ06_13865 [Myxococcales bacterium]|nr:hypothetical protein [Myxococcales bacterium]